MARRTRAARCRFDKLFGKRAAQRFLQLRKIHPHKEVGRAFGKYAQWSMYWDPLLAGGAPKPDFRKRERRRMLQVIVKHGKAVLRQFTVRRNTGVLQIGFQRLGPDGEEKPDVRILVAARMNRSQKGRRALARQIRKEQQRQLVRRLQKGRKKRIHRGLPPGGNIPYGYERNGKRLAVNLAEARIVMTIFGLTRRIKSRSDIARILNRKGFRRRNGKPWTQRQISAILQNHALYLKGVIHYGDTTGVNPALRLVTQRGRLKAAMTKSA